MKSILGTYSAAPSHWVGNGFPVRTMFSYQTLGRSLSPFLMLDYAGPAEFAPSQSPRGVGQHPHRGFETVTIVYQGELEHRDSTGAGGSIGPGDVQWMTAGGGILHEEFHSKAFARDGGTLEMVQLWVNLPQRHKMTAPAYQTILNNDIPAIPLPEGAGLVRLIAGKFGEHKGPASTFTELDVWDMRLAAGTQTLLPLNAGRTAAIVVLRGTVRLGNSSIVRAGQWAMAGLNGIDLLIESDSDSVVLVLSGEPIDEPIVGHGPFVMSSEDEIRQAMLDLRSGTFGQIDHAS
ncbi:pirin family protein [Noviherbaspirillum sp. CPCC 100848]|jgi:redox-sensitive bicupin YhaK (pirin superfamily)|uniref:Pirin family protein n=1 Tax=Noviherbaspirillum album TaxID=3080276 RepID=A0ABU6J3Y1_9BURK|nr:pirin family protein [Noviherbaspirillum sp. CPCC 100848]MEC4718343.1 pirin family protein [Noviherbaspirillum sp. CPCC 100848]